VVTATREGLDRGLGTGSRVVGSVAVLVLLGTVTPAFKVFAALRWARLSSTMVDLAMLMYRYIFALLERLVQVHSAQRVRLGYAGTGRSLSSMGTLMGAMILGALDQAGRTHEAMLVRLYDSRAGLPMSELGPLPRGQWAVLAGGVAALAGAFAICQWGPI
jgi:cobalt/nickel transport system permease protein